MAATAGAVAVSVARPGEVQRGGEFHAKSDDLCFLEVDNRRKDSDVGFRACTGVDRPCERVTERLSTVGISGTVFLDGSQIYTRCSDGFGPGDPQTEKKRIPEGYIRDGNVIPSRVRVGVGNGYVSVGQR